MRWGSPTRGPSTTCWLAPTPKMTRCACRPGQRGRRPRSLHQCSARSCSSPSPRLRGPALQVLLPLPPGRLVPGSPFSPPSPRTPGLQNGIESTGYEDRRATIPRGAVPRGGEGRGGAAPQIGPHVMVLCYLLKSYSNQSITSNKVLQSKESLPFIGKIQTRLFFKTPLADTGPLGSVVPP